VQVPVERIEAVSMRHYTSRCRRPALTPASPDQRPSVRGGEWRGLHTIGGPDSIDGINGIGHAAMMTDASLAIARGADVKVVQQMLGHSSAAMTMDVYGHLFSDRLDEVADALDNARSEASRSAAAVANAQNPVAKVLPNADVVDLAAYKPQVRRQIRMAPPARFELALPPPEGGALSPELRGPANVGEPGR
jgi:hypothetical protein